MKHLFLTRLTGLTLALILVLLLPGCNTTSAPEQTEKVSVQTPLVTEQPKTDETLTPTSKEEVKSEKEELTKSAAKTGDEAVEQGEVKNENQESKPLKSSEEDTESVSVYIDEKTGWQVLESTRGNFTFRFKFPKDWKMERKMGDRGILMSFLTSPDIEYGAYGVTKAGMALGISNLGNVGNQTLEELRGDYGTIGKLIEEKVIKIDNKPSALLSTWEGNFPIEEEEPGLVRIGSKVISNINERGFEIGFGTGGDKRQKNYEFFKQLLDKIEIVKK